MPYEIRREGDKHCVYHVDGTKRECHDNEADAERQKRLMEAAEKEMDSDG